MARWRLTQSHYLNVPGTEWEYKETTSTGKQGRKLFPVPMLLNPDDPNDCNYPGEVIVCHEGKGHPKDITFIGPPTPDMAPLDDEAEQISAEMAPNWQHPIDSLPGNGYSQSIISDFEKQMTEHRAISVRPSDFQKLQEQVAALMSKNAELEAQLPKRRA